MSSMILSWLFNFTLFPVISLFWIFDYLIQDCPSGQTLTRGECLKNCPKYTVEHDSKCVLYADFQFAWEAASAFCNDLNGTLLYVKTEREMNKVMERLDDHFRKNYPMLSTVRDRPIFIGGIDFELPKFSKDELRVLKREIDDPKSVKKTPAKSKSNDKKKDTNSEEENSLPCIKWNETKSVWEYSLTFCDKKVGKKSYKTFFLCEFPLLTYQEIENDPECGVAPLDPVLDPSHLWPLHIDEYTTPAPRRQKRVVYGHPTNFSYWPWYGALNGCGSTLVHPDVVITAAHCKWTKRVNFAIDKQHPDWRRNKWFINVIDIRIPDRGTHRGCSNDIKLLMLNESVKVQPGIAQPICLPEYGSFIYTDQTHYCFIAGYGMTKGTALEGMEKHLQQIQLHPVETKGPMQHFHPANETLKIIPGPKGGGALGDSGGPVVCRSRENMKWELVGPFCGGRGHNGYTAHLGHWRPWIDKTIYDMILTHRSSTKNKSPT